MNHNPAVFHTEGICYSEIFCAVINVIIVKITAPTERFCLDKTFIFSVIYVINVLDTIRYRMWFNGKCVSRWLRVDDLVQRRSPWRKGRLRAAGCHSFLLPSSCVWVPTGAGSSYYWLDPSSQHRRESARWSHRRFLVHQFRATQRKELLKLCSAFPLPRRWDFIAEILLMTNNCKLWVCFLLSLVSNWLVDENKNIFFANLFWNV